jgi:cytochrome c oxidase assembly factor CtaG
VRNQFQRVRPWLTLVAAVTALVVLVPPVGTAARQYAFAEAVQFAALAVVVPALIVLGAPWQRRLARQVANARSHHPGAARAWLAMIVFIVVAQLWRLPGAVNALVRHPWLVVAEAVTLIAAGCALWLELVDSPPLLPRTSRPQRAALAALPMWTIWASAYIMGFSRTAWFSVLAHASGHGLGTIADQEIASGLLWAIPGLCFVPVVYVSLITWLRDSADPDDELREVGQAKASGDQPVPRPPRGWRLPSA